jgi:hypothetical protein
MTDGLKANWAVARGSARDALDVLVEPALAKEAARRRALALRDALTPDTQLLTARPPGVLAILFGQITRD